MKVKWISIFICGGVCALVLDSVISEIGFELKGRGSAVQIAAPSSTIGTQKSGTKPKSSTDSGDGFGTLYAATTYRISTEGCEPGEVRIVRDITRGLGASMFPQQTDCVMYTYRQPEGEQGAAFNWRGVFSFSWPQSPNLYVQDTQGPDANVIGFDDPTLPAGRVFFIADIGFSGDLTPVLDPNPILYFFLSFGAQEDDTRTELELATEITTRFAAGSVVSPPIIVYSLPTA